MDENKKVYEAGTGSVEYNENKSNLAHEQAIPASEIAEARLANTDTYTETDSHTESEVLDLKTHHMDVDGNLTVVNDGHDDARYYAEDRHDERVNEADRDFPSAHDYNTHDLGGEPNTDVTRDGEAYGNFQPSDFDTRENVVLDPDQTRVENVEEIDPTVE